MCNRVHIQCLALFFSLGIVIFPVPGKAGKAEIEAMVREIDARVEDLTRHSGRFNDGKTTHQFDAHLDATGVRRIVEGIEGGEIIRSQAQYHYVDNQVIRYYESGVRKGDGGTPKPFVLRIHFEDGLMVAGMGTDGPQRADPTVEEAAFVRGVAHALRERVADPGNADKIALRYQCGEGRPVKVDLDLSAGTALVIDEGTPPPLLLDAARSASGMKYEDGGNLFFMKGAEARYAREGEAEITCRDPNMAE